MGLEPADALHLATILLAIRNLRRRLALGALSPRCSAWSGPALRMMPPRRANVLGFVTSCWSFSWSRATASSTGW
jgi:hypothetical protein